MASPTPLPSKLKALRGTYRADRAAPNEPEPEPAKPSPPHWLSKYARSEWRYIVPKLDELGLLAKIDRAELAAYCEAFANFREATEALQVEGNRRVIQTSNGNYIQNPWVSIQNKAAESMHRYAQQFGMSPSARTRISVDAKEDKHTLGDDLAAALYGS